MSCMHKRGEVRTDTWKIKLAAQPEKDGGSRLMLLSSFSCCTVPYHSSTAMLQIGARLSLDCQSAGDTGRLLRQFPAQAVMGCDISVFFAVFIPPLLQPTVVHQCHIEPEQSLSYRNSKSGQSRRPRNTKHSSRARCCIALHCSCMRCLSECTLRVGKLRLRPRCPYV